MTSIASTSGTSSSSSSSTASTASPKSYASTNVNSVDWNGLINASYESQLTGVSSYNSKISTNQAKISAYSSGQSLLQTLQSAANALRAPTDSLDQSKDVFQGRTANLTAVGGIDAASTVSVTSNNSADTGTHSLTISQLAQAEKIGSSSYTGNSTALSLAGTVTLGTTGGKTAAINISSGMSLTDIAGAINTKTSTTGIQASVLKISDTSYQLVVSTTNADQKMNITDPNGVFTSLGLTKSDGSYVNELQKSQAAEFAIDGVSMTRSTNDVSDALNGSTLHLYATTPSNTSVNIAIAQDTSKISTAVNTFVTAYNSYRSWALTQQATGADGTASSNAPLFGDSTVSQVNTNLQDALNYNTSNSQSMATIGLSFDSNNNLTLDSTTLSNALANDPSSVQSLLAYSFDSSSSDLRVLDRGEGGPRSFTMNVNVNSDGTLSGVSVDGNSSDFTVDGNTITGAAGSAYDGYSFVYTGSSNAVITVNQSSGIADQIYNIANDASNTTNGSFQTLQNTLNSEDTDYQTQISNIQSRAQTYKDNLTTKYAKIQGSISTANSDLSYLNSLTAQSSSSS